MWKLTPSLGTWRNALNSSLATSLAVFPLVSLPAEEQGCVCHARPLSKSGDYARSIHSRVSTRVMELVSGLKTIGRVLLGQYHHSERQLPHPHSFSCRSFYRCRSSISTKHGLTSSSCCEISRCIVLQSIRRHSCECSLVVKPMASAARPISR